MEWNKIANKELNSHSGVENAPHGQVFCHQGWTAKVLDSLWPWAGSSQRYCHHGGSLTSLLSLLPWKLLCKKLPGGWWNPWTASSKPAYKLSPHTAQPSHLHGLLHSGQIYLIVWVSYRLLIARRNKIQKNRAWGIVLNVTLSKYYNSSSTWVQHSDSLCQITRAPSCPTPMAFVSLPFLMSE